MLVPAATGIPQRTEKLDGNGFWESLVGQRILIRLELMPADPDPDEVAAQLRKLLDAVEDGRLVATTGPDRRLVALIEGAVVALEETAKRSTTRKVRDG